MNDHAQLPPHDADAEAAVLSAVILDPTFAGELGEVLRASDFFSSKNRWAWEAIQGLVAAGEPIDLVTVSGWLKTHGKLAEVGVPYLAHIADAAPAVANLAAYARTVTQWSRVRALIRTTQTIAADARSIADGDIDGFIERAEAAVSVVARDGGSSHNDAVLMGESIRLMFEDMEARAKGLVKPVPTGFRDLDWLLVGETGETHIVGARPGMGKTSYAMNVCINAARSSSPCASVVFSLEMKGIPLTKRVVATEASVPLEDIRRGRLTGEQWTALSSASNRLAQLPIAIDCVPAVSVVVMRSRFRQARAKLALRFPDIPVRLVVVDYLQLMGRNPGSKAGNREQEIAEISRGLAQFAIEEDVLVLALAQLNRGVEKQKDRRPGMADLRESGAIEQDATAICFLYRDEVYDPNSADRGKCEVIVGKSRNGATGKVMLSFDGRYTRFGDVNE